MKEILVQIFIVCFRDVYFLGEQKAQDLVKQFEELKKSGGLNKHLEKRRKKNMSRDRKKYTFD